MDITLFNFRTFWEANADEDYREDIIRMSIALMTFLKNNNLLVDIDPFNEDGLYQRRFDHPKIQCN